MDEIGVGLIGYGLGGRAFHAPYVGNTPGMALRAVVSRDPAKVHADLPGMRVVPHVAGLLAELVAPDMRQTTKLLITLGYAGWAPGQLEHELALGEVAQLVLQLPDVPRMTVLAEGGDAEVLAGQGLQLPPGGAVVVGDRRWIVGSFDQVRADFRIGTGGNLGNELLRVLDLVVIHLPKFLFVEIEGLLIEDQSGAEKHTNHRDHRGDAERNGAHGKQRARRSAAKARS